MKVSGWWRASSAVCDLCLNHFIPEFIFVFPTYFVDVGGEVVSRVINQVQCFFRASVSAMPWEVKDSLEQTE